MMNVPGMATYNRTITDRCRKNKSTLGACDEVVDAVRKELGLIYDGWPIGLGVQVHIVVSVERPEVGKEASCPTTTL